MTVLPGDPFGKAAEKTALNVSLVARFLFVSRPSEVFVSSQLRKNADRLQLPALAQRGQDRVAREAAVRSRPPVLPELLDRCDPGLLVRAGQRGRDVDPRHQPRNGGQPLRHREHSANVADAQVLERQAHYFEKAGPARRVAGQKAAKTPRVRSQGD